MWPMPPLTRRIARYRAAVDTASSPSDVFGYVSDLTTTRAWDPGVSAATRSNDLRGKGAEFRVTAELLGRTHELDYQVIEYEPIRAVTFLAQTPSFDSQVRITCAAIEHGTRVIWDGELSLTAAHRVGTAVLNAAYAKAGARALAGLRRTLPPLRPGCDDVARVIAEGDGRGLARELGDFHARRARRPGAALLREPQRPRGPVPGPAD